MSEVKIVSKVWGEEHWLVNRDYCGKRLLLKRGYRCSMHYHKVKHETFYLQSGRVLLEHNGTVRLLVAGDVQEIPTGTLHRFTGLEDSEIIEFSSHHMDEDSYRQSVSGPVTEQEFAELLHKYG